MPDLIIVSPLRQRMLEDMTIRQFGSRRSAIEHSVDVTHPKFAVDHILFIEDDDADLVEMDGVHAMGADRTIIPGIPFCFQGNPHNEPT